MGKKYKNLTHEQHIKNANDLAVVAWYLEKMRKRCSEAYPKNHKINTVLNKMIPMLSKNNIFTELKNVLDHEYHEVTTDSQFEKQGHVYYHLEERYKAIVEQDLAI